MPLHELCNNKAKEKLDPSNDHSSAPKNDLFELVWENGQVSVQGQSSRARKIPTCKSFPSQCLPSHSPRIHDKEVGYTNTKMGAKFWDLDAGLSEMNLSHDEDEMIPWLNYGVDDSSQHDYSSCYLHELSAVTMNELVTSNNNFSLLDRRSKQGTTTPSTSQLYQPLSSTHQCQTSFGSARSRVLDVGENNTNNDATQQAPCGEITQIPPSSSGFSASKMERQGQVMSSNSSTSTIMNFSHFAKPAAIVKANLQNIGLTPPRSESVVIKNKGEAANRSNLPGSTKVDLSDECPKKQAVQGEQVMEQSRVDLKQLEPKLLEQDATDCNKFGPACEENVFKIDQASNIVVGESGSMRREAVEKSKEPAVVSSSVCSDNGVERGFDDLNQNLKRKRRDAEESDCHSEDVEEESVGVRKAAPARGMGSKRSRSAEVHNLSERRRRDRINERMRALQELIPNCNKADKASMLDEAIEYLKTLQLQLQIMSMGAGLYMPTMMLPMGMHTPHMAPFSPMGVGMQMGLGMGYGMGIPEVNDHASSRFPMVQVPQMQGPHLPVPHTSGMARPNPQVFGLPGQGLPVQMPRAPVFPFPAENLMHALAQGINTSGTAAGVIENVDLASGSSLKDPLPNVNPQVLQNSNGCNSANQMLSTQCEANTGGFEHSTVALDSGHLSSANYRGVVNLDKENNLVIDKSNES